MRSEDRNAYGHPDAASHTRLSPSAQFHASGPKGHALCGRPTAAVGPTPRESVIMRSSLHGRSDALNLTVKVERASTQVEKSNGFHLIKAMK